MDYNKNLIIIGILLLSVAPIAIATPITTDDYGFQTLDYSSYDFLGYSTSLPDNTTTYIYYKTNTYLSEYNFYLKFQPANGNPPDVVNVTIGCHNVSSYTFNISDADTWYVNQYAIVPLPLATGDTVSIGELSNRTTLSNYCEILPDGQDLFVTLYVISTAEVQLPFFTAVREPSTPLADIVGRDANSGTRGLLNSGFVLMSMLIMIGGLYFITIFIIFTWKVFEYFATALKRNEQ